MAEKGACCAVSSVRKKVKPEEQINEEGIRFLGKHVSREKAWGLLAVTLLVCAMPMVLGALRWSVIPETVTTGLTGVNGQDDSLPRWAVVFLIPGLMCLLNGIAHGQLMLHQGRMKVPPKQIRIVGRWGVPIVGTFLSSAIIQYAAGEAVLPLAFTLSCILSLIMMILGGRLWDCSTDALLSLRHALPKERQIDPSLWKRLHRIAGVLWLVAGLLALLDTMLHSQVSIMGVTALLIALVIPELLAKKEG